VTALHLLYLASLGGAVLFFAAGAATMALRRRPMLDPAIPDRVSREHVLPVETYELDMLRARVERAEAANAPLHVELERLRTRTGDGDADARLLEASSQIAHHRRMAQAFEERAKQLGVELDQARSAAAAATNRSSQLALELERASSKRSDFDEVQVTKAAPNAQFSRELDRAIGSATAAEERAKQIAGELERAKTAATAAAEEAALADSRAREAERQLAERAKTVRDLSARAEQLEGRVRDAEALRTEYVRLRTSVSESQFLKSEVARLEQQVRTLRREALAPVPRRQPRSSQQHLPASGTIAESLTAAIERFSDPHTRSIAIADPLGFPLASTGEDGSSLAAYAALLLGAANRATELLPMANPTSIEIVDDHGARVSVWTFEVERERMLLVDLSVAPVDPKRVDAALADLSVILAPTTQVSR
jgi:hypothetical protein